MAVNDRPAPVERADELVAAARAAGWRGAGDPPAAGRARWPNDPYAPGEPRYRVLRVAAGRDAARRRRSSTTLQRLRAARHGWRRLPDRPASGRSSRQQPARRTTSICNADESEPGTFKDRQILAEQPHLVLEGLLLGMVVVGAEQGWVFIRHEYGPEEAVLEAEIEALRAEGLLGDDVLGSGRRL